MQLSENIRRNGPFLAILFAILLTAAALSIATLSLLTRM